MFDPDKLFCGARFRREQLLLEAAWRFQLVAPLLGDQLDPEAKARLRKHLVVEKQQHPYRGEVRVSERSLRRWCQAYRARQLDGLWHQPRTDAGRSRCLPPDALDAAKGLLIEDSRRSVPALIRLLRVQNPQWASLKRTTLGRHLRAAGLRRASQPVIAYIQYEATAGNRRWQGDVLHGPKVKVEGKLVTAKVVSWIDDYSRYIVHIEAFDNERLPVLEHTLTRAIAKYGKPDSLLVDNGKIYSSTSFTLACSQLGIRKIHSSPYHPESKGKQERFFRTLRDQLLNEVENVDPISLEQLNLWLQSWLDGYHTAKHSETQMTPMARYSSTESCPVARERLEEAFLQWCKRKVTVQGLVAFAGQSYHVDPSLAGKEVLVRYNPFDLSRIWLWQDGHKLCHATAETLLQPILERRPKKAESAPSSASLRYLLALEAAHRRKLDLELNLMRLEDENDE
jgi:transposase InsO family protein